MSEDDADDWIFQSIKLYTDLHMYELQYPTQTIEWTSQNSLAVACQLTDEKSEILHLALPGALAHSANGEESIGKAIDFKVLSGGMHPRIITKLKQVPNSRILLAAEKKENCVTLWDLPNKSDDSGLITNRGVIQSSSAAIPFPSLIDATESRVTFGSHMSNVSVADISTCQTVFSVTDHTSRSICFLHPDPRLSELRFLDENTLLSCQSDTGLISIIDTRDKYENQSADVSLGSSHSFVPSPPHRWVCDVSQTVKGQGGVHVRKLCSDGRTFLCDVRRLDANVEAMRLERESFNCPERTTEYLTVKCGTGESFSVSGGSSGNVSIYNSSSIHTGGGIDECCTTLSPTFTHTGHRSAPVNLGGGEECFDLTVLTHCWVPGLQPSALLSAANDGSLHAWQIKDFHSS